MALGQENVLKWNNCAKDHWGKNLFYDAVLMKNSTEESPDSDVGISVLGTPAEMMSENPTVLTANRRHKKRNPKKRSLESP